MPTIHSLGKELGGLLLSLGVSQAAANVWRCAWWAPLPRLMCQVEGWNGGGLAGIFSPHGDSSRIARLFCGGSGKQDRKAEGARLLKALIQHHPPHIQLAKANHKTSPDSPETQIPPLHRRRAHTSMGGTVGSHIWKQTTTLTGTHTQIRTQVSVQKMIVDS